MSTWGKPISRLVLKYRFDLLSSNGECWRNRCKYQQFVASKGVKKLPRASRLPARSTHTCRRSINTKQIRSRSANHMKITWTLWKNYWTIFLSYHCHFHEVHCQNPIFALPQGMTGSQGLQVMTQTLPSPGRSQPARAWHPPLTLSFAVVSTPRASLLRVRVFRQRLRNVFLWAAVDCFVQIVFAGFGLLPFSLPLPLQVFLHIRTTVHLWEKHIFSLYIIFLTIKY